MTIVHAIWELADKKLILLVLVILSKMSKVNAIDVRVGNIIKMDGGNYRVLSREHVKPGKGGAFVQLEMKEIITGSRNNQRLRSSESVEIAHVNTTKCKFLYQDGDMFEFMDSLTSEQISVSISLFENNKELFLDQDMDFSIESIDDNPVAIVFPSKVKARVKSTQPHIKGQTVTMQFKPATLENGVVISVPPFIKEGEDIYINTETMEYDSRV